MHLQPGLTFFFFFLFCVLSVAYNYHVGLFNKPLIRVRSPTWCRMHLKKSQNINFFEFQQILEKLPPYGRLFSSSCGELQPSAANSWALIYEIFWQFFSRHFFCSIFLQHFFGGGTEGARSVHSACTEQALSVHGACTEGAYTERARGVHGPCQERAFNIYK